MEQFAANPLLSCLDDSFALVADFQSRCREDDYEMGQFRKKMMDALTAFDAVVLERTIPSDEAYYAKYAITAFIDEAVIQSDIGRSSSWIACPLQLELFGDSHAGEQYFHNLSELRVNSEKHIDVLEVFFICLELGYQGYYRFKDKSELFKLKADLLNQIQGIRKMNDLSLSHEENATISDKKKHDKPLLKKAAFIMGGVIFIVAVSLWINISIKAKQSEDKLLELQQKLLMK